MSPREKAEVRALPREWREFWTERSGLAMHDGVPQDRADRLALIQTRKAMKAAGAA